MFFKGRSSGVTLVEMLISITIFSVMSVGLIKINMDSSYRQRLVVDYTFATLAASSQLEYLKSNGLKPPPVQLNINHGFTPDENMNKLREVSGSYYIEKFKNDSLYKIVVTVSWKDLKGRKQNVSLWVLKGVTTVVEE